MHTSDKLPSSYKYTKVAAPGNLNCLKGSTWSKTNQRKNVQVSDEYPGVGPGLSVEQPGKG